MPNVAIRQARTYVGELPSNLAAIRVNVTRLSRVSDTVHERRCSGSDGGDGLYGTCIGKSVW